MAVSQNEGLNRLEIPSWSRVNGSHGWKLRQCKSVLAFASLMVVPGGGEVESATSVLIQTILCAIHSSVYQRILTPARITVHSFRLPRSSTGIQLLRSSVPTKQGTAVIQTIETLGSVYRVQSLFTFVELGPSLARCSSDLLKTISNISPFLTRPSSLPTPHRTLNPCEQPGRAPRLPGIVWGQPLDKQVHIIPNRRS